MNTNSQPHPHRSTTTPELFFHVRQDSLPSNGRHTDVTVFFRQVGNEWKFTTAVCHRKDNFCKRQGRTIARRRWFNPNNTQFGVFRGSRPDFEAAQEIARDTVNSLNQ